MHNWLLNIPANGSIPVSQFYGYDIWQKDFEQLDFSVEKKLAHHWYVYAKVTYPEYAL